jgi:predicted RNA-binding protein with PIN domain
MPYLIDGNNLMGQRVGWHKDKPKARRDLMQQLSRFSRSKKVTVTVVFDGAPDTFFPDGSSFMGVKLHYAVRGSSADERIKEIVESSRERRTLIVVTSDRALADYVRRCGAQTIKSGEFRKALDSVEVTDKRDEKVDDQSLDNWMRYFGVSPEDE